MSIGKNTKGIIAVLVVSAAILTVFLITRDKKDKAATNIIKLNGTTGSYSWLMGLDEGYLTAWANALSKGQDLFTYNNAQYYTQGGTKKTN